MPHIPSMAERREAAHLAINYLAAKDRAAYARRRKLTPGCLVLQFAEAIERHPNAGCVAATIKVADADLAEKNGWPLELLRDLEYRVVRDRFNQPLVVLESPLGNGQEIRPDSLRRLAAMLSNIADQADCNVESIPIKNTLRF